MPYTDNLMALGGWTLDLDDAITRDATYDRLDVGYFGYAVLVVTPTWVDPKSMSVTDLRAFAEYIGIYRSRPSKNRLAGCSLAVLLGDEQGKGKLIGASPFTRTAGTLEQWAGDFLPVHGLDTGAGSSSPATTYTGTIPPNGEYWSPRRALQFVCDATGGEWKITNSNGTAAVDVGAQANLYGSTPIALVVPRPGSRESTQVRRVVPVTGIEVGQYSEDWTSDIIYRSRQAEGGVATATNPTIPFYGLDGNALGMQVYLETSAIDPGNLATLAATELAKTSGIRQEIVLKSNDYIIPGNIRCGYLLSVYAPEWGLIDTAGTPVPYAGGVAFPTSIRCVGTKTPFGPNKGVYIQRTVGGTTTTIDLSQFYVPETGDYEIMVGSLSKVPSGMASGGGGSSRPGGSTAQSVIAPVGVALPRGPWVDWAPAFVQSTSVTVGGSTSTATYQASDYTCRGEVHYQGMTASGGSAGSAITMTLPVTADYVAGKPVGWWRHYDSSTATPRGGLCTLSGDGSKVQFVGWTHGALGNDPNLTLGAGDELYVFFDYETASAV